MKTYKDDQKALETYDDEFTPDYDFYLSDYSEELLQKIGDAKLLKPNKNILEKVILCSYPRSGNTFIGKIMEEISGTLTGSDCLPKGKLNFDLYEQGLRAEGKVGREVWMVKSHFPERSGTDMHIANKCVLVVGNPLDCLVSFFNMGVTASHNNSIHDEDYDLIKDVFDTYIREEIKVWKEFHSYWCDGHVPIPTYVVGYEDLMKKKFETVCEIFAFLLNVPSIEGTVIEGLIGRNVELSKNEVYKPRKGKAYGNGERFSSELYKHIKGEVGSMLKRLDYVKNEEGEGQFTDDEDIAFSESQRVEEINRNGETVKNTEYGFNYKELNKMTMDFITSDTYLGFSME